MVIKKKFFNREKITPFECGFRPITRSRLPFSINFFLVGIIFLIFDLEIILLMPMIFSIKFINRYWIYLTLYILVILVIGIFVEWIEYSIYWIF